MYGYFCHQKIEMNYKTKIKNATEQIARLENEIESMPETALPLATIELRREIDDLNNKINRWQSRLNETPEEKQARQEAERKEAERLDRLNRNFDCFDQNDWDY